MLCSALPVRAAPVDPSGVWLVEDGTARIRIEHCRPSDDHVCGYIVWTKDDGSPGLDAQNPDPAKQTRPLLGIQLILGFSADDDHYAGKLYNAENGKLYDTQVKLEDDGTARIRIEHCRPSDDHVCGYIVWTKDDGSPGLDAQNPDPAKQTRPLLGIQLILGFSADDDHYAGKLYNAENGKLYDTQVKLEDDTHLSMKGCVLRYLCGSQTWTKVDDVATGQLTAATDAPGGPRADAEWAQDKASAGHKHTKKKAAL